MYIETTIYYDSQEGGEGYKEGDSSARWVTMAMLQDVLHFLLGWVKGAHNITVHILFPYLELHKDKFQALTREQFSRWFDWIFHPAIYKHCAAHYSQYLLASFY